MSHISVNHSRKGLMALPLLLAVLLTLSLAACGHHSPATPADDYSRLHGQTQTVFVKPDSIITNGLRSMKSITDSGLYHRTATFVAIGYLVTGNFDSCKIHFDAALDYVRRNPGDYLTVEQVERDRSLYFNLIGQLDSSLYHSRMACKAAEDGGLWKLAVKNLSIVGEAEEMLGRPIESAASYRRAIHIGDSLWPERIPESQILVGIAATYTSMGNFDNADKYLALNATQLDTLTIEQQYFHFSTLGNSLYQRKDYSEALDAFRKSYVRAQKSGDPYLMAVSEGNMGECFMFEGRLDSADHYISMARERFDAMAVTDVNLSFYMNSLQGDLELRKGNMQSANKLLAKASADTSKVMPRYQAMHYDRLRRYYESIGDYRSAINYLTHANVIHDSIKTGEALNYAADLEYRYRQDTTVLKSHMRISQKEEEVKRLREYIIGVVLLLIIIVLGSVLWTIIQRRKANNEEQRLRTAMQSLRMENVSNRVSSHFIFNVLNGVATPESRRISNVANLIRRNIELSGKAIVTLAEEVGFIDNYVAVERDALSDGFDYTLTIGDDVDMERPIPAMMIQLFVENAIKHGLRGYDGPKYLNLSITHDDNRLLIKIVNNGHLHSNVPGTGTGLRVVSQTMHMLNARNREKMTLFYGIDGDHYRVVITIPDNYNFDAMRPR